MSEYSITALCSAINYGNIPLVNKILLSGIDINSACNNPVELFNPLYSAVLCNNRKIIKLLIEYGVDLNKESEVNGSIIHISIFKSIKTLKLLLRHGANPNICHKTLGTPLCYFLSMSDNTKIVKTLIDYGADVNMPDSKNHTPLYKAICYNRNDDIIHLLLKNKANTNINHDNGSLLHLAVCISRLFTVSMLLNYGADINFTDFYGYPPLYRVAITNRKRILRLLLERGADPNIQSNLGRTPLHGAVLWMKPANVKMLLSFGADVNIADGNNQTPLSYIQDADNDTALVLVSHICILAKLTRYSKNSGFMHNVNTVSCSKKLSHIRDTCNKEINKLSSVRLNNKYTLESFLTMEDNKILYKYIKHPNMNKLNGIIIYYDIIVENINKARRRYMLLENAIDIIDNIVPMWRILPIYTKWYILESLSDNDLDLLVM
ncbi:ankyrin repeat family protein [Turkeypox virus]|uniref:Ankyrin repeat family protein n=1 Tax=Turkeypox virus TaxID=336486 RepID=A0A0M3ZI15_9POXV|nr:ankyrin repeat family protein [Turkeypox virus]ALA62537.1 ankyrin repeat family protein [Turkeypox virus]